ncbi:hypothetical protein WEI85_01475 [Actinomycetes bacterium KLBMP 9797]
MVSVDHNEPADVVDRLLWRDAQNMLGRHAQPNHFDECVWCGAAWPCPPRRLAERAEAASRRPWREAWTVRHDLNGLPGWRDERGWGGWQARRGLNERPRGRGAALNSGSFS